jgi:hypothetical protein
MIQKNVHIAQVKDIFNCFLADQKHAHAAVGQENQKNKAVHLGPSRNAGFFLLILKRIERCQFDLKPIIDSKWDKQ